jgi:hypothetical protein
MVTVTDTDTDTETENRAIYKMEDVLGRSLSLDKDDDIFSGSSTDDSNPVPPPPTPLLGAVSREQHFIFVRTEIDDEENAGCTDEEAKKISLLKSSIHSNRNVIDGMCASTAKKSPRSSRRRHHRPKGDGRSKNDNTEPPHLRFDYFSDSFSQSSFNSTDQGRVFEDRIRQHSVKVDSTKPDRVRGDKNLASGTIVLASSSTSASTTTVLVKKTGVLQGTAIPGASGGGVLEKNATSSGATSNVGAVTNINIPASQPVVNTTANPLGTGGATALPARHSAATTIVVQQASVTGGSPTVATVLLKNCSVSAVSGSGASGAVGAVGTAGHTSGDLTKASPVSNQQREESMKQLLDVANTLTLQELHDFEMR